MKIVAINGSPKGSISNTSVMVNAFFKGAEAEGAETSQIFLADKKIEHCKGCHVCWSRGPGQCVTNDDMQKVLWQMGDANVIVFATPVYFENISGMLKVFMDRMTMIGSPHSRKDIKENRQELETEKAQSPKLMMIANCGYPDKDEFQVVSLWIRRVTEKMRMDLAGEIYAAQGKLLSSPTIELQPAVSEYLLLLERAGREIASNLKLSEEVERKLEKSFIPKI